MLSSAEPKDIPPLLARLEALGMTRSHQIHVVHSSGAAIVLGLQRLEPTSRAGLWATLRTRDTTARTAGPDAVFIMGVTKIVGALMQSDAVCSRVWMSSMVARQRDV